VAEVDFGGYLTTMTSQLIRTATDTRVKLQLDVEPIPLKVDVAIPCGLIVNELVTNALKHAFPPEMDAKVGSTGKPVEPTVSIGFHRRSASLLSLGVQDNGIGFSDLGDFREMTSMGMTLVNALVRQISATITVAEPTADSPHGSSFVIEFSP
jgi:two-component sensor histidine kinase